jgi:hypothetical protein
VTITPAHVATALEVAQGQRRLQSIRDTDERAAVSFALRNTSDARLSELAQAQRAPRRHALTYRKPFVRGR